MSLSGIRDMSVLKTPPPGRKEIETHVVRFNEMHIKDAIENEMRRGGQTFFVVPRIAHIEKNCEMLLRLVPKARISVAHGKSLCVCVCVFLCVHY